MRHDFHFMSLLALVLWDNRGTFDTLQHSVILDQVLTVDEIVIIFIEVHEKLHRLGSLLLESFGVSISKRFSLFYFLKNLLLALIQYDVLFIHPPVKDVL